MGTASLAPAPGRARRWIVLVALAASLAVPASAAAAHEPPTPGAADVGDPLFPGLGNGGYDVREYELKLVYGSAAPVQAVPGRVEIEARATQSLSRFNLDFGGDSVAWVEVNGRRATFTRQGEELVITPPRPIRAGRRFETEVAFTSGPQGGGAFGWFAGPATSATAAQPHVAHLIFPSNDHPSDPARYTIRALAPKGSTFVANGVLRRTRPVGDFVLWTYEQRQPMASELIQLAFGALTVIDRGRRHGVRLRDVVPTAMAGELAQPLAGVERQLAWMTSKVGRYPFDAYGSLVSDADFFFALETQTLSLYPSTFFSPVPGTPLGDPRLFEPIMVHELAHQWYGNHVTPARWSDLWLNEGHATWYEYEYAQEEGDPAFYFGFFEPGVTNLEEAMRAAYRRGDALRAVFGPVAAPRAGADAFGDLFSPNVYEGGALVLYALRQVVGDRVFRDIERRWLRRFGGGPASTSDFIALASREAGRDLTSFLTAWLYGTRTPPMPGHPDWTVDPVAAAGAATPRASIRAVAGDDVSVAPTLGELRRMRR